MTSRFPITIVVVTAALAAGTLTGCSTGTPSASVSASAGQTASGAPASGVPAHSAFSIPSTCLSAAEVQGLLGLPEHGPTVNAKSGELICEYLTPTEDGAIILYQTKPGETPATLAASAAGNAPADATVTAVAHLGDAAYEVKTPEGDGLVILTGSTLITIGGGDVSLPRLEALAVDVLAG